MEEDLDDTVISPVRSLHAGLSLDTSDTIVRGRPAEPDAGRSGPSVPTRPAPVAPGYGFVINSHEPITLDRPAYIGRKPTPPRVTGGVRPRLVRIPSPLGEVSGTHLELREQGTMVIATDLKSTNGTRVRMPGSPPVRLRQSESIVVTPGALIEVGDGNVIEIISLRRAHLSDQPPGAAHS